MDYSQAGVNTKYAGQLINDLKSMIQRTHRSLPHGKVVGGFGGFAGAFRVSTSLKKGDLVAATDGVGTKIQLYRKYNRYSGIGQDLVAMCVNDLYCAGATPLFFLDYISCEKLDDSWYAPVIRSIAAACEIASISLLGGETAEHPGVMPAGDFDLAGFAVGMVPAKSHLPKTDKIKQGDRIYSFPSSGLHSNGFSLIRKLLPVWEKEDPLAHELLSSDFVDRVLLRPTRIYWFVPELLENVNVHALVHVTGGGIYENLPRVLPSHLSAIITNGSAHPFPAMRILKGRVSDKNCFATFNMGNGLLAIAPKGMLSAFQKYDPRVAEIGSIVKNNGLPRIQIHGVDGI